MNKKEQLLTDAGWSATFGGWKKAEVFESFPLPTDEALEVQEQLEDSEKQGAIL